MATAKVKVWQWRDIKRAVEGVFVPGERKALLDDYGALSDLVSYGKRPPSALLAISKTEWRDVPLPAHAPTIKARLAVITSARGAVFTVVEVRVDDGGSGQPNGPWYEAIAQEINRATAPTRNPSRAKPRKTPASRPRKRTRP